MWFRRNLRVLHDNPSFIEACRQKLPILCVYVLTPYMTPKSKQRMGRQALPGTALIDSGGVPDRNACGRVYFQYLINSLRDLQANLRKLGRRAGESGEKFLS